ncbi:MAG: hypothetical protein WD845_03285 [Pirellulales bacterium]
MKTLRFALLLLLASTCVLSMAMQPQTAAAAERRLNNLAAELLVAADVSGAGNSFTFTRPTAGWIFVAATCQGKGAVRITLDPATGNVELLPFNDASGDNPVEAMRQVAAGPHALAVECTGDARVEKLVVRAIPELMHCGLGFDPAIKSYGRYDLEFLKKDILPNVTTLVVPHSIDLPPKVIDDWHRQGKKFVAEVGINGQATTADEHCNYWTGFLDKAPFLDGILINEFIVNAPSERPIESLSAERRKRLEDEQARYRTYEAAIQQFHRLDRYRDKLLYAYVGGSGRTLNQEVIGPTFVRTLIDCDYRIALERYLFERSSEHASREALDEFVRGITDWETRQPGAKEHMIIAFGLFSMPPGGINKLPGVDYHVWMDQQMHTVANNPALAGIAGLEWWTSLQADEETVRFVGKLYRHYAIEGHTDLFTRDPLFLPHLANADFQQGTTGWTLQAASPDSIAAKSFPRYGRIEGRYMGLGRPADPEHLGDTFLWMKRSAQGPNKFSQAVSGLEPGRLYSLKMFTCDYQDLVSPQAKTQEEANKFIGAVTIEGVDLVPEKCFTEAYASNPEPKIPVWITYHWKVFRAKGTTAQLTISDWPDDSKPAGPFGQEQTFNFLELEPYWE